MAPLLAHKTRQRICRSLFILLGLLPLLGSVGWATWRNVTHGAEDYVAWVAGQTGLDMRVRDVVHARPNETRLEGVNIVDPEDGRLVARCDDLVVRTGPDGTGLHFSKIAVQPDQFSRLLEILHERILRQRRLIETPVFVVAERVVLPANGHEIRLTECRLDAYQSRNGPEAMLVFRWVDRPESELVRLHLLRDQTHYPATTHIELLTGDTDLPCTLLYRPTQGLESVVENATFRGNLRITSTPDGWNGDVSGYLNGLRFEALNRDPSNLPLVTGSAAIDIRRCNIVNSWIQELDGRLHSHSGVFDAATMSRVAQQLNLSGETPIPETGQVSFDEMTIDFQLSPGAVVIRGACSKKTGVVVTANNQVLFREPTSKLSSLQVIQSIFNLESSQVPVSAAEQPLLRAFPLPRN